MSLRGPTRIALLTAALAALAPAFAHAQALTLAVNGGVVTPVRPMYDGTRAGAQFGVGASHATRDSALSLGAELSVVRFGGGRLAVYPPIEYMLACPSPGCSSPPATTIDERLGLVNYLATAKYDFGVHPVHPYLALAGGVTQSWSHDSGHELNGSGRATAGVESRLGRLGVALDVSYATVSTLKYHGHPVRYVPVTLRLSF